MPETESPALSQQIRGMAGVDRPTVIRRLMDVGGKPMLRADADDSTHSFTAVDNIFGRVIYVMRPLLQME